MKGSRLDLLAMIDVAGDTVGFFNFNARQVDFGFEIRQFNGFMNDVENREQSLPVLVNVKMSNVGLACFHGGQASDAEEGSLEAIGHHNDGGTTLLTLFSWHANGERL